MSIVMSRVDERLVHGQIMTSWSKHLGLSQIVVVDDELFNDEFMKEIILFSAPKGLKILVLESNDIEKLKEIENENSKTMLLFKNVENAKKTIDKGFKIDSLNLGNVSSSPSRKSISRNVSLSEDEYEMVKELESMGVNVYLQMVYTDSKIDFNKINY